MMLFPVFPPFFCLLFNLWSSLLLPPTLSLNSIAYRRVICVYQYQVADDLSGRSTSLKPRSGFFCFFLTHAVPSGPCDLMHCSLKDTMWSSGVLSYHPAVLTSTQSSDTTHPPGFSQHPFSQWTGYLSPCLPSVLQGWKPQLIGFSCTQTHREK